MRFLKSLFQPVIVVQDITDEDIFASIDDDFMGVILVINDGTLSVICSRDEDDRQNIVDDVTHAMDTNTTISLECLVGMHGPSSHIEIIRGDRIVRALVI